MINQTEALEATWVWRTGAKVGRTIYACPHRSQPKGCVDPSADVLIGMMDSPEIAEAAVHSHNHWLQWVYPQFHRGG